MEPDDDGVSCAHCGTEVPAASENCAAPAVRLPAPVFNPDAPYTGIRMREQGAAGSQEPPRPGILPSSVRRRRFCPTCGAVLDENAVFCAGCGGNVPADAADN